MLKMIEHRVYAQSGAQNSCFYLEHILHVIGCYPCNGLCCVVSNSNPVKLFTDEKYSSSSIPFFQRKEIIGIKI